MILILQFFKIHMLHRNNVKQSKKNNYYSSIDSLSKGDEVVKSILSLIYYI